MWTKSITTLALLVVATCVGGETQLSIEQFITGQRWKRVELQMVPVSQDVWKELTAEYEVLQGYDPVRPEQPILIEKRYADNRLGVRFKLSKHGLPVAIYEQTGSNGNEWFESKVKNEEKKAFELIGGRTDYFFLPLPLKWTNASFNLKALHGLDILVVTRVHQGQMTATVVKARSDDVKVPPDILTLYFNKESPWATRYERTPSKAECVFKLPESK